MLTTGYNFLVVNLARNKLLPRITSLSFFCLSLAYSIRTVAAGEVPGAIRATLTSVYQYGFYSHATEADGNAINDRGRGSFVLDLQGTLTPGEHNTLFALGSFAHGNGLNDTGGVSLVPNGDDLEDDVHNINGTGRDYLLEAWYRRQLLDRQPVSIAVSGGLIDATRYLDSNRYANDNITQFMNETFVNRFFLPSYDPGISVETAGDDWRLNMVWMRARADTDNNGWTDYDFYGIDLTREFHFPVGEGHISLHAQTTSNDLEARDGNGNNAALNAVTLSVDQAIGETFGVFVRAGTANNDTATLVHDALYSAGFEIGGHGIGLPELVVGVAYAYLDGAGNQPGGISHSRVAETYARYPRGTIGDISADAQWISDSVDDGQNPGLRVIGSRLNLYF